MNKQLVEIFIVYWSSFTLFYLIFSEFLVISLADSVVVKIPPIRWRLEKAKITCTNTSKKTFILRRLQIWKPEVTISHLSIAINSPRSKNLNFFGKNSTAYIHYQNKSSTSRYNFVYLKYEQFFPSSFSAALTCGILTVYTRSRNFSRTNKRKILNGALNHNGAVTIKTFFNFAG